MSSIQTCTVRHLEGVGWQVQLGDALSWRTCRSELDARYIAHGLEMAGAIARGEPIGEDAADELDEAAAALLRNVGPCPAEQVMKTSANRARQQT
jgi:hypothetical protein